MSVCVCACAGGFVRAIVGERGEGLFRKKVVVKVMNLCRNYFILLLFLFIFYVDVSMI